MVELKYAMSKGDRDIFGRMTPYNFAYFYLNHIHSSLESLTPDDRKFFEEEARKRFGTTDRQQLILIARANNIDFDGRAGRSTVEMLEALSRSSPSQ